MKNFEKKPLIKIIMATYNGEAYLSAQLDSILAQSYDNYQIIVSDDGSTDRTIDILADYINKHPGKVILLDKDRYFGSACSNFFYLMEHCGDGYVMFCDQDDVWDEDKIAQTLDKLRQIEKENRPALVFTDLEVVNEELRQIAPSFMRYSKLDGSRCALNQLLVQNVVAGCTAMANDKLIQLAREVLTAEDILMHDWWIALIAAAFGNISYFNKPTVKYRQHNKNTVGAKDTRKISYVMYKVFSNNDLRESLRRTVKQAERFSEIYGDRLCEKNRALVNGYSHLYQNGKLARLLFLYKNKIFKYGLMRKIAQMIWG